MKSNLLRCLACLFVSFAVLSPLRAQTVDKLGRIVPPAANSTEAVRIKPGDRVAFVGSNLGGIADVRFGLASGSIFSRTATQVVATVPLEATTGPVSLYASDGFGGLFLAYTSDFDFELAPRVTKFARSLPSPASPADEIRGVAGNSILFTGANFISINDPAFATTVYFPAAAGGYVAAPLDFASQTTIQVRVPIQAVSGNLVVSNPSGYVTTTGKFYLQPLVTSFDPPAAQVGDTVTLSGYSLLDVSSVLVRGVPATILASTGTNIQIRLPTIDLSGAVTVTTPGGAFLTATSITLLPTVGSFLPAGGAPGTLVTVTGTGLAGATQVKFGNLVATSLTPVDSTSLTATVPFGAFTGPVTVTTPNGSSTSTNPFYVAPVVASFSPQRAKVGALVTLVGDNIGDATTVVFGGGKTAAFSAQSTNRLTAIVPDGAINGVIVVTTPGGAGSNQTPFQVIGNTPVILDFTPAYAAVGATVKIIGDNLGSPSSVKFNGTAAVSFVAIGGTNITVTVPDGATSGPISVTTPLGTATSNVSFLVGTGADLAVTAQADTTTPAVGGEVQLTFTISNLGPLPSSNPSLGISVASGVDVIETTASVGSVEQLGLGITAFPGTLASGAHATVHVRVRTKTSNPALFTAVASSDTLDPTPANDTASVTLVPSGTSGPSLSAARDAGKLRLSWSTSGFVAQGAASPTGTWTDLNEVPTTVEGTTSVAVDVGTGTRFFRLRQGP